MSYHKMKRKVISLGENETVSSNSTLKNENGNNSTHSSSPQRTSSDHSRSSSMENKTSKAHPGHLFYLIYVFNLLIYVQNKSKLTKYFIYFKITLYAFYQPYVYKTFV